MTPIYRVAKFGGTSVQDHTVIRRVADIVSARCAPDVRHVVVLSAMGGITDLLLGAAEAAIRGGDWREAQTTFRKRHMDAVEALLTRPESRKLLAELVNESADELGSICQSLSTLKEHTRRILDMTAARGERLLARIFRELMQERGLPAEFVDATEIIKVERLFGSLFPDLTASAANAQKLLVPRLAQGQLVILPGYIGTGPDGELVTLGRGGSDLSATVLGHCLAARDVTLYKEVDGLLTADPRYVSEARIVPELHYREAAELAYYGAKVLHPRTIIPLLQHQIPLVVRSTFRDTDEGVMAGTRIAGDVPPGAFPVKALTAVLGQSLLSVEGGGMMGVPGVAARTFQALAQANISVAMISQASSEASICFVVADPEVKAAVRALQETFKFEIGHHLIEEIRVTENQAILAVVGLGMKGTPGISARTFAALARAEVNVEAIAQGSSELNISVVIDQSGVKAALGALHREFRLEKLRALPHQREGDVRFAVCGVGQIGRTLLRQIALQHGYLKDKMHLDLRCIGLLDRSGLLLQEDGFDPTRLAELLLLKENGAKLQGAAAGDRLWQLPLQMGIFVDTTADETAPQLLAALRAGWHVVVANKKPLAVPQAQFDELFATAKEHGVSLRYEATVGAGLPILDTLAKLEEAGDEVQTILGCFSGTLGYLMTELSDGAFFSDAVRRAHSLGYTEPDPREDLSGMDVARKALILARTLGIRIDLKDLAVQALFPPHVSHDDPQVFIENLKSLDPAWSEKIASARREKKELRYVARISRERVSVGIEAVPADSPLGRLRGTDNQVTVTTRRYDKNPLIVSGPGAGAEVTAAGVLNDILAIATAASPRGR